MTMNKLDDPGLGRGEGDPRSDPVDHRIDGQNWLSWRRVTG